MLRTSVQRIGELVNRCGAATLITLVVFAIGCASDLYVDASAPACSGDGSKSAPFKTIREAVTAARVRTTIHIAQGTYLEKPETIIVRDRITLEGSTILDLDDRGLPKAGRPLSHAAVVEPEPPIPQGGALFRIHAAHVAITGLVIDGKKDSPMPQSALIFVDGAQGPADGFRVEGNVLKNAGTAVVARLAAGTIQGNYITQQRTGISLFGWRPEPSLRKRILFRRNRVTKNEPVGALVYGALGSRRVPKFESLGVCDGAGMLRITVSENDFRGNGGSPSECPTRNPNTGLYFLLNDDSQSDPTLSARVDADIHDNTFTQNVWYGVAVGQRIELNERLVGYEFTARFEGNRYCGNGLNAAMFDFRHIVVSHNSPGPRFRFGRRSIYTVDAVNDLVKGDFDYDHPEVDPDAHDYTNPPGHEDAGAILGNSLIFNGAAVLNSPPGHPQIKPCPPVIGNCPP